MVAQMAYCIGLVDVEAEVLLAGVDLRAVGQLLAEIVVDLQYGGLGEGVIAALKAQV